jgi:ATP adenylyltransferase
VAPPTFLVAAPSGVGDRDLKNEQLWAPWRLAYVQGETAKTPAPAEPLEFLPGADENCFLCRGVASSADRENLLVYRGREGIVVLNRYPYNNGHLLVCPRRHKGRLDELSGEEQLELLELIGRCTGKLEKLLRCEGFNIGLNVGRAAGAGVPGHLHWHIVPRWSGDSNFMPVLAGVAVISQSLDALWDLLADGLKTP